MAQLGEGRDIRNNRPDNDNENDDSSTDKTFSLHDLTKDDKPHDLFICEIQCIFQYGMKDILETITELDMDVLSSIHNKYKDRRAVQRTVAKDIWFLGFSIANRSPSKELDKIFKDNISETDVTTNNSDQPHHVMAQIEVLIQTMNDFDTNMKALQTQVNNLQNDNALLHAQLAAANATTNQSVTTVLLSAEDGTTSTPTPPVVPSSTEPSESDEENFQIQRHQRKKLNKRQNVIEEKRSMYNRNPSCRNSKANCLKRTTNVALQLTPRSVSKPWPRLYLTN